ncbi:hypothetical protein OY671_008516 [Metschnikowia pulcherrima]|nr:hypothetical protein OY671_008516 [Metschnikowia pulcherrima]
MAALGARVERAGKGSWSVRGVGVGGFTAPDAPLDFGNSGTGCRLAMGAVAGCPVAATFDGDASSRGRPMRRILDPSESMGTRVTSSADGGRSPMTSQGARDPIPVTYRTPVASAQIKSAVSSAGCSIAGVPFRFDTSTAYVGASVYSAIPGSVIGFTAYSTSVGRMGPARAAYCTVSFPVVALSVSTFAEGYQWTPAASSGSASVMFGNSSVFTKWTPFARRAVA